MVDLMGHVHAVVIHEVVEMVDLRGLLHEVVEMVDLRGLLHEAVVQIVDFRA